MQELLRAQWAPFVRGSDVARRGAAGIWKEEEPSAHQLSLTPSVAEGSGCRPTYILYIYFRLDFEGGGRWCAGAAVFGEADSAECRRPELRRGVELSRGAAELVRPEGRAVGRMMAHAT